ncbi:methylglyoxal synthase [uncultured Vibrio sp.]|uniref:methylglyoxal synthase n=1 Tax=Vibrio sp. TaxID=678 RepID=UPI002AA607C1|nr:methylglyoxal synthase [uncultured Vibrio sp.]
MDTTTRIIPASKHIALVAHDNCKAQLLKWVGAKQEQLKSHTLYATGTTGHVIQKNTDLTIISMISGPMGGDQQIGSLISQGSLDMLIFFWDPLNSVPHDPDVKALLRIASVWNIPVATNQSTADFLFASECMSGEVEIEIPDYEKYLNNRT